MKKYIIILILMLTPIYGWTAGTCGTSGGKTGTSPYTAETAEYADVADCVADVEEGATINLPSGTKDWTGHTLTINKAIIIKGAGIDSTILEWEPETEGRFFAITPASDISVDISNMTLNNQVDAFLSGTDGAIYIVPNPATVVLTKIKIHDIKFLDVSKGVGLVGNIYGVLYSCQFIKTVSSSFAIPVDALGKNRDSWDNHPFFYGTADNFFVEDNILIGNWFVEAGHGGRYLWRYNTWTEKADNDFLDAHGNQSGGIYSTMGVEFYGNSFQSTKPSGGARLYNQRGGQTLFFYNKSSHFLGYSSWIDLSEEVSDSEGSTPCNSCIQHINNSYYWTNIHNSSQYTQSSISENQDVDSSIAINREYWIMQPGAAFDGTGDSTAGGGVGCGTLASRPATCTTGVAYWATNQSCTDLTGMVGANPSTPISGTLYKCTSTNKWEPYYTPYTYPHPLRVQKFTGNTCSGCGGYYN